MGKISDIALTGLSGRTYRFGVFTLDADFRNMGAVCVFARHMVDPSGQARHNPVYIGQTDELGDWLCGHRECLLIKEKRANCVCVHVDWNEDLRGKIEKDLIGYYNPPCNNCPSTEPGAGRFMPFCPQQEEDGSYRVPEIHLK